jgi:hypothetical protein
VWLGVVGGDVGLGLFSVAAVVVMGCVWLGFGKRDVVASVETLVALEALVFGEILLLVLYNA